MIDWRSGKTWRMAGWIATGLWIAAILVLTGNDTADPLYDLIFIVPLAGWIVGVTVARLVRRRG